MQSSASFSSVAATAASATTPSPYTRSALLQWANASMCTNYAALSDVPAKAVALLLNAIYGHQQFPLNRIEFTDSGVTSAQRKNCEVVVAQAAALLGYEGRLSADLWYKKEDTANELLFWRWVRMCGEKKAAAAGGWAGTVGGTPRVNVSDILMNNNNNGTATSAAAAAAAPTIPSSSSSIAASLNVENFLSAAMDENVSANGDAHYHHHHTSSDFNNNGPPAKRGPRSEAEDNATNNAFLPTDGEANALHKPTTAMNNNDSADPALEARSRLLFAQQQAAATQQNNARLLQQTASLAPPISRSAEAFHATFATLQNHLAQNNAVLATSSSSSSSSLSMGQQQQQTQQQQQSSATYSPASIAADPYISTIIDAKNDKLLFLQSIRSRLIAACHAKDRAKVMEVMCAYMRGGGVHNTPNPMMAAMGAGGFGGATA